MRAIRFFLACLVPAAFAGSSMLGGCSDPPAPLPQGGWQLTFKDTGASCDIKTHNASVGTVTAAGKTELVTDGVMNAEVSCSVVSSGGGFKIDKGRVYLGGSSVAISIANITKDATKDAPAQGSVSYVSPDTQNIFASTQATPCNFYFLDPAEGVTPGNIWVAFECAEVAFEAQTCAISGGYIKLANCDGAVIEE